MDRDLILLGGGPSKENCPFDTEVWAALTILRCKGWENKPYSKLFNFDTLYYDLVPLQTMARERNIPIVGPRGCSAVTELYPMQEIIDEFNSLFFRNVMSYMIPLALLRGYKSLSLWGVDQGPSPKHASGRRYVTYWLGVATGRGVQWEMSPGSILWRDGNE